MGGAASVLRNRLWLLPSTFIALAVRRLWEPGSCPQGTLKELQYLSSKFKGGNAQGVSEVWEKEQSRGRRGKTVAQRQVGRNRKGRRTGS